MSLSRRAAAAALLVAFAFCPARFAAAESATPPACGGRDIAVGLDLAAARAARADELTDAQGLLWRVERDGIAPSYLFGTIHSTDESAAAIARRAAAVASKATVVATELGGPFDAVDRGALAAKLLAAAIDRDADTFQPDLAGAAGASVEALLAAHGVPKELAHHLKLWFLAASVEAPACEQAREQANLPEVDEIVAEAGAAAKIPVVGLETADEQLTALAAMKNLKHFDDEFEQTNRLRTEATQHLIEQGCRTIAHIRGPEVSTALGRMEGYRKALFEEGMQSLPGHIASLGNSGDHRGELGGYEAARQLLKSKTRPDGIFCFNDPSALGAMRAILDAGLRIPADIAVVGCGNLSYSDFLRIPLSSVDQGSEQIGRQAAQLAMELITKKNHLAPIRRLTHPQLIVRASSSRVAVKGNS